MGFSLDSDWISSVRSCPYRSGLFYSVRSAGLTAPHRRPVPDLRWHQPAGPRPAHRTLDMLRQYTEQATQALETGSVYRQVFWNW